MASSDSENDCFESAEESLDEDDNKESEIIKFGSHPCESKPEVENLSPDSNEFSNPDENPSSASLSYRKRPERLKRSNSITQAKLVPKSSSSELVFKSEKIVPDVSLQDITSNLSKNINKSLTTLHQKSSNVKDLILNSLPLPLNNESEKFSYDEKNFTNDEIVESDLENSQKDTPLYDFKNVIEGNINAFEKIETKASEAIFSVLDKISGNSRIPKPKIQFNSEVSEEIKPFATNPPVEECNYTLDDTDVKNLNNVNPDNTEANLLISQENVVLKTEKNREAFFKKKKSEASFDDSDMENSSDQSGLQNEEAEANALIKMPSVNLKKINDIVVNESAVSDDLGMLMPDTDEKTDDVKVTGDCSENNQADSLIHSIKSEDYSLKTSKNVMTDNGNCNNPKDRQFENENEISEKNYAEENEEHTISSNNLEETIRTESGVMDSGSNDTDYLINTVADNLVTKLQFEECICADKKGDIKNTAENDENIAVSSSNHLNSLENKIEVNENSNDGWDDFDFSDDENDPLHSNNLDMCKGEKTESVKIDKNEKPEIIELDSCESGKRPVLKDFSSMSSNSKTNNFTKDIKAQTVSLDSEQSSSNEINSTSKDGWDWDDWGDFEDTEEKLKVKTSIEQLNPPNKDNISDISGWSGWDTFGQKTPDRQSNWGLGSWGVDMILNKASAVTQGISNVLEAGLGAPDPETLARMEKMAQERVKECNEDKVKEERSNSEVSNKSSLPNVNIFPVSGITSLVAGVTSKIVEHSKIQEIGSKVITGGLDTLETFGKKTMEVLQEGDPGLKNKRALLLGQNKPVLSQVLKEAREKADKELKRVEEKEIARKCHFETLFDDFQGMVHLEALEMLSTQCELKLDQMKSGMNPEELEDLTGILDEVEQLCCLDECDFNADSSVVDFKTQLQMAVEPLKKEISVLNIIQIHESVNKWLKISSETSLSYMEIHQKLVSTLAELAAATVHQFHKSGELLSIKECRKTVDEVDSLLRLTNILCNEINKLCDKFIKLHNSQNQKGIGEENSEEKVTLVRNNSTSYIRQAFNLLIPVIQLGAAL